MKKFGDMLRQLRTERSLSQAQLARLSGLSQNSLSYWESNAREPSWSAVVRLARALGVPTSTFDAAVPCDPDAGGVSL